MLFTEVYASLHTETENAGGNRPHLVVLQGPGLGDFFEITDDELVLGSDPFSADIVVRDVEVEPRHAELYRRPGGYVLRGVEAGKTIALNGEVMEEPGAANSYLTGTVYTLATPYSSTRTRMRSRPPSSNSCTNW